MRDLGQVIFLVAAIQDQAGGERGLEIRDDFLRELPTVVEAWIHTTLMDSALGSWPCWDPNYRPPPGPPN